MQNTFDSPIIHPLAGVWPQSLILSDHHPIHVNRIALRHLCTTAFYSFNALVHWFLSELFIQMSYSGLCHSHVIHHVLHPPYAISSKCEKHSNNYPVHLRIIQAGCKLVLIFYKHSKQCTFFFNGQFHYTNHHHITVFNKAGRIPNH